jgi:hypothetical protein
MDSKKRRSEGPRPVDQEPEKTGQNLRIFVRRGAIRRYARLTRDSRLLPVNIDWDRRKEEDRREEPKAPATERRKSERRRKPPFTWEMADFVVTESKDKDDK